MPRLTTVAARVLVAACLLGGATARAATVSHVILLEQGAEVVVTYDLEAEGPVPVVLMASTDGGRTFDLRLEHATGDAGDRVAPGVGRQIRWSVLRDFPSGTQAMDLVLDVVAGPRAAEILRAAAAAPPAAGRSDTEYAADVQEEQERLRLFQEQRKEELADLAQEEKRIRLEIDRLDRDAYPTDRRPEDQRRWEERRTKDRDAAYRRLTEVLRLQDVTQGKIRQIERDLRDLTTERHR